MTQQVGIDAILERLRMQTFGEALVQHTQEEAIRKVREDAWFLKRLRFWVSPPRWREHPIERMGDGSYAVLPPNAIDEPVALSPIALPPRIAPLLDRLAAHPHLKPIIYALPEHPTRFFMVRDIQSLISHNERCLAIWDEPEEP